MLIITTFSACSGTDISDTDETTATAITTAADTEAETESIYKLAVPDELDYDGYTFRFLGCPGENKTTESFFLQYTYDTENGDIFNDSLYKRNMYVKEYLNIQFETQTHGNLIDIGAYRKAIRANDDSFDCGLWLDRYSLSAAQDNLVYPFQYLTDMYVDLDNPWWMSEVNKAISIDNKLYFASGAFDLCIYGTTPMLLFNKEMAADLNLENMYDLVRNGKWTVNAMYENMKLATADLNGDSVQDGNDQWGYNYVNNFLYFNMSTNNDEYFFKKDENDHPYFAAAGNERLLSIGEAVYSMLANKSYAIARNDMSSKYLTAHAYEDVISMFADGKSLYSSGGAIYLNNLRGMEQEFGILPFPKMDEYEPGTDFYSYVLGFIGYTIPTTISDPEMASAVLETLAYSSYNIVVPVFRETVLQLKSARDEESAEILAMLTETKNYRVDLGIFFLDSSGTTMRMAFSNPDQFVSEYEKNRVRIEKAVAKAIETFQKIE